MAGPVKEFALWRAKSSVSHPRPIIRRRRQLAAAGLAVGCTTLLLIGVAGTMAASASQPQVNLATAAPFAVLAGSTITNTGPSSISGDLGLYPGTAVTGFPPGKVSNGTTYVAPSGVAEQAQADLTTAYVDAAGRTPRNLVSTDLGGQTLAPGVYESTSSMGLTGTVTLDGQNDLSSVFIFQAGSTLKTASNSSVKLIDGAQACNVFWQVGSSATLGSTTSFVGSVLALSSATLDTGATVDGRVLARNGAVTLDDNTITSPTCATTATTTTTSVPTTTAPKGGPTTTTSPKGGPTTTTGPKGGPTTTTSAIQSTTTTTAKLGATTTTTVIRPTTTLPAHSTTTTTIGHSTTTTTSASVTTTTAKAAVTTTTSAATTTTTSPSVPSTTVPSPHTGEPWSGWPYWALVAASGLLGFTFVTRSVLVRRRRT